MKGLSIAAIGTALLALSGGPISAQSPTMYTLGDIYDYLVDGTEATEGGHSLEPPPGAVSGDTRLKTLKEIYEHAKLRFDWCNTLPSDVAVGKRFFSTEAGSWGAQTGTNTFLTSGLLITGQTMSFMPSIRDDGYYQKGVPYDYTDNFDGTLTDNFTGLIWAREGDGAGCKSGASVVYWTRAIDWAEGLTFAGYSDWRLPNISELFSLAVEDAAQAAPFITQLRFPNTRGFYWSSTTFPYSTGNALVMDFNSGCVKTVDKDGFPNYYVRAVRGGE